ncbi:putative hydrolase or acyltransferase of alpha/beta superfamily [Terriglobus roseus DSM 18391]|uniref:Putative hydrolase or acyltransferase of alpha/beta superfamily n=1 Tax=Terriglobus roseus (strain DSM 18391 / NRRL B-41598 / KBS 63) TaxID=926566 RepID=I3ZJH9_TERRK|nr:alpha/beta fold hydrolase [Terriglobus roseus]AFL89397.1 putative hydrolase or acyltransferase of alpha/beta superfamily [Terriglobus roseus DSM 18391]
MLLKLTLASVLCSSACSFGQVSLPAGEHQATINGVKLWFKVAGQRRRAKSPALFLHGGAGYNSYSFEKTIGAQLEGHVQIIYLDERGSGRSERPVNRDYAMTTLVQDVEALRRSLGIQKLSLMGHSFGGTIALEYASRYPEHVEKLIVLDGAADMPATFSLWEKQIEQRYPAEWHSTLDSPAGSALKRAEASHDGCAIAKAEFSAEMTTLQKADGQTFHDWQQFHSQGPLQQQRAMDQVGEVQGLCFSLD